MSGSKIDVPKTAGRNRKIGIVVSRYHAEITEDLLKASVATLRAHGTEEKNIKIARVPGAFEIPLAAQTLLKNHKLDAVICLGVVIKGETPHNEYISREVARGISMISLNTGIPVLFGVLTPNNPGQARARAGGDKGNKGAESAEAALAMIQLVEEIKTLERS
jgi:6,7-dimethyl-8-ribityllumazine synthase